MSRPRGARRTPRLFQRLNRELACAIPLYEDVSVAGKVPFELRRNESSPSTVFSWRNRRWRGCSCGGTDSWVSAVLMSALIPGLLVVLSPDLNASSVCSIEGTRAITRSLEPSVPLRGVYGNGVDPTH